MKQIEGFPDYLITEDGKVWSNITNKFLKPVNNGHGYYAVGLHKNNKIYTKTIHRLVAKAFIYNDDPENKKVIDHIDANKLNNNVSNLEWVTSKENNIRAVNLKLRKPPIKVKCVETGEIFKSASVASQHYKLYSTSVKNAIKYNRLAAGYHWIYC